MINLGLEQLKQGFNPNEIKKGMDYALKDVCKYLDLISLQIDSVDKIKQVASISANNDENIGELFVEVYNKVGKEGVITVEEAKGTDTYVDVVEGMQFDRGYLSPWFITNESKMTCELVDSHILILDKKIENFTDLVPVLEEVLSKDKSLLIISDTISEDVLSLLVANKVKAGMKIAAVKAPAFGERRSALLQDIAVLTNSEVGDNNKAFKLGHCDKIVISADSTTIFNKNIDEDKVKSRVDLIKQQMQDLEGFELEKAQERIGKLSSGIAVIYVGANTEVEMLEKKDRIDDAIGAVKSAIEEGVIPGGGVALFHKIPPVTMLNNKDFEAGANIVYSSLSAPIRIILENAGLDSKSILSELVKLREESAFYGYDAKNEKFVEDMILAGIIDPVKVTKTALTNAVSIASMLLTTEYIIDEHEYKRDNL